MIRSLSSSFGSPDIGPVTIQFGPALVTTRNPAATTCRSSPAPPTSTNRSSRFTSRSSVPAPKRVSRSSSSDGCSRARSRCGPNQAAFRREGSLRRGTICSGREQQDGGAAHLVQDRQRRSTEGLRLIEEDVVAVDRDRRERLGPARLRLLAEPRVGLGAKKFLVRGREGPSLLPEQASGHQRQEHREQEEGKEAPGLSVAFHKYGVAPRGSMRRIRQGVATEAYGKYGEGAQLRRGGCSGPRMQPYL